MSITSGSRARRVPARSLLLALLATTMACADRGSDITTAYRGDIAAYRQLVRVRYEIANGGRGVVDSTREVIPDFPSAAHPRPIATSGTLRTTVTARTSPDAPLARYLAPPLELAPKTSYQVNIIISPRHPVESRCSGKWVATPIASATGESLYVSVLSAPRGVEPPRCDD